MNPSVSQTSGAVITMVFPCMCSKAVLFLCSGIVLLAQSPPIAFTGARIIPITGPEIPDGAIVIGNGKIIALGAASSTAVPDGAKRVNVAGKVIMPGIVDSHSHIGSPEGADSSSPIQPDVRMATATTRIPAQRSDIAL